uniref:Family with sequence similarity 78 member B n=1 Tax=Corvus moneduloides TaxID=1196302 RepID=A0A8U7N0T9_CORMO
MGCLQSVACKARVRREQIVVSDVSATIEPAATAIEESSPVVLRYRTPYFRASARVLMPPIARRHTWVVGWIQACNHMEFYNTYSDLGVSSWELPDLREGRVKAISDSDGVSYPWYGNTTETVTLVGPTNKISRFSGSARSMSVVELCPWQMLLSTQMERGARLCLLAAGAAAVTLPAGMLCPCRVHTYAFRIDNPPLARLLGSGGRAGSGVGTGRAGGLIRAWCWLVPLPGGFSAAQGEQDTFCMRLGVFGVVVSVGHAIALFCLGVRSKGRLDVLLF